MHNPRRLIGVILMALATLPACSTKRGLGRVGQDADQGVSQDTGQNVQPATGCTFAPVSVDMSCNDDPSLPKPAGGCEPDGTCWCARGFVLNPVTGRCKLDTIVDGGAVICTVGANETCNDDLWVSWYEGTCVGGVACACKTGYLRNPATGRCKQAPVTDAGTMPAGEVCTFLIDQTCNDDDNFSGKAGQCGKGGTCGCNPGFVINPATGRCRAGAKPDAATTPDGLGSQKCYWNDPAASFKHFSFLLTTPDGKAQTPPRTLDAGMWPINDFRGQVVEKTGNQFTVDTCVEPLDCQPNRYRFALCVGGCSSSSPGDIDLPITVDRLVRVVWHVDSARPMSDLGLYWLAIYDAEEGPGHGSLLFFGSGGRSPGLTGARSYFDDLHFLVATERLNCGGGYRDGGYTADDFRFVFSPKTGTGTTLRLATGESGSFEFAEDRGLTQRFQVHCLDAVQTVRADDYWNWDFWMTGEIIPETPVSVDAGRKNDASGVCTPGIGMSCNESPMYSWIAGTCQSDGTCICNTGFVLNADGLCTLAPRDAGPDLAPDAKFGCTPGMDQTCNDTPASALWGTCMANGRCVCRSGFAMNPNTGRCAWAPDWDAGAGR